MYWLKKIGFRYIGLAAIVLILAFITGYAGPFLMENNTVKKGTSTPAVTENSDRDLKLSNHIEHIRINKIIDGGRQHINILDIDFKKRNLSVKPALAYNNVFGFEKMSRMACRNKADAAVNAGFFYGYGQPAGMVIINGELITDSKGKYPVLVMKNNYVDLRELKPKTEAECNNFRIKINHVNRMGNSGDTVLYTRAYGPDNRVEKSNITVSVKKGIVIDVSEHNKKENIPENGFLLTFFKPVDSRILKKMPETGDRVFVKSNLELLKDTHYYECGSWIIKDKKIVIKEWDDWVGIMSNNDPRTAVGLLNNHHMVFVTVDGRQPGYSLGVTGHGLARILLDLGVVDAAMLDGGASAQMIVNGKTVNKPSYYGEERLLGGCFIIQLEDLY